MVIRRPHTSALRLRANYCPFKEAKTSELCSVPRIGKFTDRDRTEVAWGWSAGEGPWGVNV